MSKNFTYRETIEGNPDRVIIIPKDYSSFPFNIKTGGSYALAPARVIGLSYANYLRFIRQAFPDDVSVEGKNNMYPVAYWRKGKALYTFLDFLDARLELALAMLKENKSESNI